MEKRVAISMEALFLNMRFRASLSLAVLGLVALAGNARAEDAKIGGQLEVNYTYNFNKPLSGSNSYLFNTRDAEFSVNLGEISVMKAATKDSAGYTLRLITGRIQEYFEAAYGTGNILEAYGTQHVNHGSKALKVDVGQFLSHVGYETPDMGSAAFFSKSFSYQFLQPFVLAGVKATMELDKETAITGLITNRFDGVKDPGNRDLALGFQLSKKMSEATSVLLNAQTSRESLSSDSGATKRTKSVLNAVYSNKLNENLALTVDATLLGGKDIANRNYTATGIAGYLSKSMDNGNTLSLRGEYLSQSNATSGILPQYSGADATKKPSMTSITASYELKGVAGSRTLLEYRYDNAGGRIFPSSSGGDKKNQSTVSIAQVFKF
jgi:hypothetical protein